MIRRYVINPILAHVLFGVILVTGHLKDGQALRIRRDHARALLNRGLCRMALGDNRGALADFDSVTRIDPELHEAILQRGKVRLILLDYRQAPP